MNIQLRSYQQKFIDDVRNEFIQNHKRVVGVAPCGAGKTIMTGWIIREVFQRGKRAIFFVHRQELIKQTSETFTKLEIPHGIICAGIPQQLELPVQIASVQTLARRIDKIPAPDLLICDECHHILANTYKKIIDKWNDAFLLGVTATPLRTGGKTLCDVFSSMIQAPDVAELIKLGNLTDFDYFAPDTKVDLTGVRSKFGDFIQDDLANVMKDNRIIGNIVDHYKKIVGGKSAICYCVNVTHSKMVAASFQKFGVNATHIDGDTPASIREQLVEDFRIGKISVLCNAELFGEGFDVPNMQAVILARPTKSLTLFIQQAMRPMRPDPNDPNKRAIIVDHVQNYKRFGLPDTPHEWSLAPNPPKKIQGEPPVKECPQCGLVLPLSSRICPQCDFVFVSDDDLKDKLLEHDGQLVKLDRNKLFGKDLNRAIAQAKTFEQLKALGESQGYKKGWAPIQALQRANSYDDVRRIADFFGYNKKWADYHWDDDAQKPVINSSKKCECP